MKKSKLNPIYLLYLFSFLIFFSSCGSSDTTAPAPAPAPEVTTYKIQTKMGAAPLADATAVEMNPNDLTKLSAEFSLLENDTPKTTGIEYSVTPDVTIIEGISIVDANGICTVTIIPAEYKITTDHKYVVIAKIGDLEKSKTFVIKGKADYIAVTSISLARKASKESVSAIAGGGKVDLKTVFAVTIAPVNATNKDLIWSIDPVNPVASITSDGVLNPLSDGLVKIKVTSVYETEISSATSDFTISVPAKEVRLKSLSLERKYDKTYTKARVGQTFNLLDVFNIQYNPPNATDKRVIWSIEPPQPTVATITDLGQLNPLAKGTVRVKVTSVLLGVWSTSASFGISPPLKLVGRVGTLISIYTSGLINKSGIIEEDMDMELDPNDNKKVVGMLYASESISISIIPNVKYSVTPSLPVGVNIVGDLLSTSVLSELDTGTSPYILQVDPATYKLSTDATFTFTARVGTGSNAFTKTRTFTIKGNKTVVPISFTLERKTGQETTVVSAGDADVDLTTIFDLNFVPANTTNKNVKWSIDPPKPKIGTITEAGILKIISAGEVSLLVISDVKSIRTTKIFNIASPTTNVPVTSITLARKTDRQNAKVRISVKKLDVNEIFDFTINPMNASNKNVVWSIYPRNDTIATITNDGLLTTTTKGGTINLRVTSVSDIDKSSSTEELIIDGEPIIKASVSASLISSLNNLGSILDTNSLSTGSLFGINSLDDDAAVVLDPNGTDKLSATFTVVVGTTTKTSGITYILPNLPISVPGVLNGDASGGAYTVTLKPTTFTELIDKTYTLEVVIDGVPDRIYRSFTIKAKTAVPVTSITIERKPNHVNTKGLLGVDLNLKDIFDITFVPENASNKTVTWSIDPAQDTVATIKEATLTPTKLVIISTGTIMLKATSKSETNISSVPIEFVIEDAKILELVGTLPNPESGKYNVAWLINGDDKYNIGVISFKEGKYVKGGIPVDKVTNTTKYLITVERASSTTNASSLSSPSVDGLNLVEIALTDIDGTANTVTNFNAQAVPTDDQTFILATPSDAVTTNERSGVWFKKAADDNPGLTLPTLTGDYSYEGWVVIGDGANAKKLSTGKFKNSGEADIGKYYYSGDGPAFPGEDFLVNPTNGIRQIEDLTLPITVAYKVLITLEPTTETSFDVITPSSYVLYEKAVLAAESTGVDKVLDKGISLKVTVTVK